MAYQLDQFISDCRTILARDPGPKGREQVRVFHDRTSALKWLGLDSDLRPL